MHADPLQPTTYKLSGQQLDGQAQAQVEATPTSAVDVIVLHHLPSHVTQYMLIDQD